MTDAEESKKNNESKSGTKKCVVICSSPKDDKETTNSEPDASSKHTSSLTDSGHSESGEENVQEEFKSVPYKKPYRVSR